MLLVFTATLFCDLEVSWVYGFPAGLYRPIKTRDLEKLDGIPHSAIRDLEKLEGGHTSLGDSNFPSY